MSRIDTLSWKQPRNIKLSLIRRSADMAGKLPVEVAPGQIYRHDHFYCDAASQWQAKYLLVLTGTPDVDVVFRLLTSRAHGRLEQPPCYRGNPYPIFYFGYLGGVLTTKSWLDLRRQDDYNSISFTADLTAGNLLLVATLPIEILCQALDCAASADDTTRQQERLIRDQRAALHCS